VVIQSVLKRLIMTNSKILFFSSNTCEPCKLVKSRLSKKMISELNIEIFSDCDWDMFVTHDVQTVPTFIKIDLKSNKETNRLVGYKNFFLSAFLLLF